MKGGGETGKEPIQLNEMPFFSGGGAVKERIFYVSANQNLLSKFSDCYEKLHTD